MQSSFTIQTKELKAALAAMNRIGLKFTSSSVLKISVLPETIEIATQGIMKILKAETDSLADILVPVLILKGYANTIKSAITQFTFKPGELKCGSSIYSSSAIKVETVFNVPENNLPINATTLEMVRQRVIKNQEEIERFNLSPAIANDYQVMGEKIDKALKHLKYYEVTFDEIYDLIQKKIKQ